MIYLGVFWASLVAVFLKAFQQRNVAFDKYWWVPPVSFGMAAAEIIIIWNVSERGWDWGLWFFLGSGGAIGALAAMWAHKRWVR